VIDLKAVRHNRLHALPVVLVAALTALVYLRPTHAEIDLDALDQVPAMQFFVAHGAPNACGEGCDSWIAAEGRFDETTPDRFRQLLKQIGDARPPIFFSSPGGDVYAALELGSMLRARSMTAGVGIALPQSCLTTGNLKECSTLIHANPNLQAMLWSKDVRCASACAFALLGATRREIASEAYLGVHPTTLDTRKMPGTADEKSRRVDAYLHRADNFLPAYFSEMGIENNLYSVMKRTKLEQMHLLTRSELYDLGIDRRERVESGWIAARVEFSANGEAALKTVTTRAAGKGTQFEHMALAISCDYRPERYVLSVLRYFPDTTVDAPLDIVVGGSGSPVTLIATDAYRENYAGVSIEVRQSKLTKHATEEMLGAPMVDVVEKRATADLKDAPANKFAVSTAGASDAFKAIASSCPISRTP
jgi:hypothetical protein